MVIHNMRTKRPAYNIISNNCQNYAVNLLDAIQIGAHLQFATTFAIYQRATGSGSIAELFADKHPEEQKIEGQQPLDPDRPGFQRTDTVQNAQQVMEANTTKLDDHHSLFHMH
jgi:4-diphosphocytidyl-2C-methyl-D-erythritol kinase